MIQSIEDLPSDKKVYFASDFHLGAGTAEQSAKVEALVVDWLDEIASDAHSVFLLGDMFDFWFEYKTVIPRGFIRFQGKLMELRDAGIEISFFIGNHDMWLFDYFPKEFGIPIYRKPQSFSIMNKQFMIGHGDGLGPGDYSYKLLKTVFNSPLCQWLFARLHPNFGVGIANFWSRRSRLANLKKEDPYLGDNEWILQYCKKQETQKHHDFYLFGHRHLKLDMEVASNSRYLNLSEWVTDPTYAVFNGESMQLKSFGEK